MEWQSIGLKRKIRPWEFVIKPMIFRLGYKVMWINTWQAWKRFYGRGAEARAKNWARIFLENWNKEE